MNKKILLVMLAIALVFGMTLAGCKDAEDSLDGTWTKADFTLTISGENLNCAGSTYSFGGAIEYSKGKMTLTLSPSGAKVTCNYSLSGNQLTISGTQGAGGDCDVLNGTWTK